MTLMIVLNTINMGGQLDLEIIKAVFKKPIGPIVGFVSQFILMPLVSDLIDESYLVTVPYFVFYITLSFLVFLCHGLDFCPW